MKQDDENSTDNREELIRRLIEEYDRAIEIEQASISMARKSLRRFFEKMLSNILWQLGGVLIGAAAIILQLYYLVLGIKQNGFILNISLIVFYFSSVMLLVSIILFFRFRHSRSKNSTTNGIAIEREVFQDVLKEIDDMIVVANVDTMY